MFSVFRTPTLVSRKNIQQENNITARKPGQLSARKPFTERSNIDIKENNTPLVKPQTIVKPTVIQSEPEIDLSQHVMTFKDVTDTFHDLYDERLFLDKKGIENIYNSFLYENEQEKEPVFDDEDFFDKSIEIKRTNDDDDEGFEDVCNLLDNNYENSNFDDIPFPEIDFDF